MEYHFTVEVPFEAIIQETLDASTRTALPSETTLPGGLHVARVDTDRYVATTRLIASHPTGAKVIAIKEIEELLKLFAMGNEAFQIMLSSVNAQRGEPLEPRTQVTRVTSEGSSITIRIGVAEEISVAGHIGVVKSKGNLNYEAAALAVRERWPEALVTALDLNYLAVVATSPTARFLLLSSALEALADARLGEPARLLSNKLSRINYRKFKRALEQFLRQWDISESEKGRIKERVCTTHQEGIAQHFLTYLEGVGVTGYTLEDVGVWWHIRSKIAHGSSSIDSNTLGRSLGSLCYATQQAIRKEIEALS